MKYKIGDKVKFLNDIGGGVIKKIIDKDIVEVLTNDGFEIPIDIKELILDIAYSNNEYQGSENNKKQPRYTNGPTPTVAPLKKQPEPEETYEYEYTSTGEIVNLYLAIVPLQTNNFPQSQFALYLINDSNYFVFYNCLQPDGRDMNVMSQGKLEPNTKFLVMKVKHDEADKLSGFTMQAMFFRPKFQQLKPMFQKEIRINPVKLYQPGSFKENDFFDESAYVLHIFEENKMTEAVKEITPKQIKDVLLQKEKVQQATPSSKITKLKQEELEERIIDLHIEELVENEANMSPKEMLDVQMDTFKRELENAIKEGVRRIVFIHGIGNGKLKMDLRNSLSRNYAKYPFQDASFREYGFGATLVILKGLK